ncbi:MAG: bifunctional folylpolyglutamate synthase/dihydrofolate synthase [Synergistaceae bacterium]|nr:bifunctional folylpolyglutamate synthase/dihydrofolate synthase [Synergistaceae bacterium]
MKTFDELEEILYSHSSNEIIPGLERISRLLERLGSPQNTFKAVHIVGTNGKGSTGAFISSVLKESGYNTCFYSSPHLESPGERLLINGEALSPSEWIEAADLAASKIIPGEDKPSYFELLTACAFILAREHNIESGVIEAGLGGKLDATNLLANTACSVIASISIDHTEYLGSTLESIASEKFAVVKKNTPAVFSGVDESLIPMFKTFCRDNKALPFIVSEQSRLENVNISPEGNTFDFYSPNLELQRVKTNLIGAYQVKNAALALFAISLMRESFPNISRESILTGMLKASWPGRLEIISREPLIILDGGHNLDGVKNLCESVKTLWPDKNICVIYAAMRDKDYKGCLELFSTELHPAVYFTTVPGIKRAASPEELLNAAKVFEWRNEPEGFNLPVDAVNRARESNYDLILVCGSLYLIGYIRPKI